MLPRSCENSRVVKPEIKEDREKHWITGAWEVGGAVDRASGTAGVVGGALGVAATDARSIPIRTRCRCCRVLAHLTGTVPAKQGDWRMHSLSWREVSFANPIGYAIMLIHSNLSDLRRHLTKWKFNCEDTKLSKERHPLKKTVLLLCNVLPRSIQTMNFKKMMLNWMNFITAFSVFCAMKFELRAQEETPDSVDRKRRELESRKRKAIREFRPPSQPSLSSFSQTPISTASPYYIFLL